MLKFFVSIMLLGLCSCTLFKKEMDDDDEIVKMGEAVLKSRQGIEIQFKPIPQDKK